MPQHSRSNKQQVGVLDENDKQMLDLHFVACERFVGVEENPFYYSFYEVCEV
jgi:hypothetical protein